MLIFLNPFILFQLLRDSKTFVKFSCGQMQLLKGTYSYCRHISSTAVKYSSDVKAISISKLRKCFQDFGNKGLHLDISC